MELPGVDALDGHMVVDWTRTWVWIWARGGYTTRQRYQDLQQDGRGLWLHACVMLLCLLEAFKQSRSCSEDGMSSKKDRL